MALLPIGHPFLLFLFQREQVLQTPLPNGLELTLFLLQRLLTLVLWLTFLEQLLWQRLLALLELQPQSLRTEKLTVYGNIWGSGNIILQKGSYNITLTPTSTLTANRTITFPRFIRPQLQFPQLPQLLYLQQE